MNPCTPKPGLQPSTRLRKAVIGGALMKALAFHVLLLTLIALPGLVRAADIAAQGATVLVPAGEYHVGDRAVKVAQAAALPVTPAPSLAITDEPVKLSVDKPVDYAKGTRLCGCEAKRNGVKAVEVRDEAERVALHNEQLTIVLSKADKGAIVSLADNATGQEFIAKQKEPCLFRLVFTKKGDVSGATQTFSSRDAQEMKCSVTKGGKETVATLEFKAIGGGKDRCDVQGFGQRRRSLGPLADFGQRSKAACAGRSAVSHCGDEEWPGRKRGR